MPELKIFSNPEFGKIRTIEKDGEPWFIGKDIASVLGYAKPLNALAMHVDEDDSLKQGLTDSMGRMQETILINESGVYSLIFSSKLPKAKEFKHWVTSEVLPSIHKHGMYASTETVEKMLADPNTAIRLLEQIKAEREQRKALETKIEQDKPKVLFADAVETANTSILIGELAKLLHQNGIGIGQNRLFDWMRQNGYLIRRKGSDYNMPTQKAMDMHLFEIKETTINHPDGHIRINKTVKVTGKGQTYFVNLFLKKERNHD